MDWISRMEPFQLGIAGCLFVSWDYSGLVFVLCLLFLPLEGGSVTPNVLFTDLFWYSFYEEVAPRGFALAYLVPKEMNIFSLRSLVRNVEQTLLFVSIQHRYATSSSHLFLVPVLLLGLADGFIFPKTKNIFGCFLCHSLANPFALPIPLHTWKPWRKFRRFERVRIVRPKGQLLFIWLLISYP